MSGSLLTLGYLHHAAPNARRLAMQQGLIRLWCRRNHRRLSKIYFDLGRNRAARDEMRARLSDHANALLVVPALHHLTRDGWALLDLLEAFLRRVGLPWWPYRTRLTVGRRRDGCSIRFSVRPRTLSLCPTVEMARQSTRDRRPALSLEREIEA